MQGVRRRAGTAPRSRPPGPRPAACSTTADRRAEPDPPPSPTSQVGTPGPSGDATGPAGSSRRARRVLGEPPWGYSHSMVPGGLLVTSSTTRLISRTSLVIRLEILASTS